MSDGMLQQAAMIVHPTTGIPIGFRKANGSEIYLPTILAQSAVSPGTVTGTTNETTLLTLTVPGGVMGPNGIINVHARFTVTASANNKTLRVRFAGNIMSSPIVSGATYLGYGMVCQIRNRGNRSVQIADGDASGPGGLTVTYTSTVNTAVDQILTITGQLATGSESIVLESYSVHLLPSF